MLSVGIAWQMYALTDSALHLGLVGLAQFLPQLLLTLVVGHVADRYSRRNIVMLSRLVRAGAMAWLAWESIHEHVSATTIYICACLLGAARAFQTPAASALLPNIVPKALLSQALALNASAQEASVIIGPALGGFIYLVGAGTLYTLSAAAFLFAALLLLGIHTPKQTLAKTKSSMATLLSGFTFIRKNPVVFGSISLDLFAVLLGGATALLPIVARDILHTGPWGLGILRAAPAIGAVLMSLYLAKYPLKAKVGKIMFISVAVFGICTIVFRLSSNLWLSLLALALMGAGDMISMVIRNTLIQLETPDDIRGRVSAVNSVWG